MTAWEPAAKAAYDRAHRAKHPDPWHKAAHAVTTARLRARKYGLPDGSVKTADMARLHLLPCTYCGTMPAMGADHLVPLIAGGPNELSNLVPACYECNRAKGRKSADDITLHLHRARLGL